MLVWGADTIARAANLPNRKSVYYLHRQGLLKSIRKIGRALAADTDVLRAEIAGIPAREMLDEDAQLSENIGRLIGTVR
jgi:hypothetical protein